jgi:hypothetical protein
MGSPAVAALIAQIAFWALLTVGLVSRALSLRGVGVLLVLWLATLLSGAYRPSCVAILDIALVFMVVKGDVRLS